MNTNLPDSNPAPAPAEGTVPTYPYHYYLSVVEFHPSSIRTADMELSRAYPIRTMEDVAGVKQWLCDKHGFVNPQVSFSLLRTDLAAPRGQR